MNAIKPDYYGVDNGQDLLDLLFAEGRGEDFCYGCIKKYLLRHESKDGQRDVRKAREYYNRLAAYFAKKEVQRRYMPILRAQIEEAERVYSL